MKSFLLTIILLFILGYVNPAPGETGDYNNLIADWENSGPAHHPGLLKQETGQSEFSPEIPKFNPELKEMQKRWNHLIENLFEKDSYYFVEEEESNQIEAAVKTPDLAMTYLRDHSDIDSLLKVAYFRNLNLQSIKKELEAKLEGYSQVVQLEDILSQFSYFVKELDTKAGPVQHQMSIKQSYPFPGALSLKAHIAEQEVRIAKAKYEIVLRDTLTQIKEAFYEWAFLTQAIRITEEHLKLLQELEIVSSVHFRTGKGGFNDVIKAQIKTSKLKDDLVNLKEEKFVVEAKMAWFLNISTAFSLGDPPSISHFPVNLSIQELRDISFNHQQELELLREKITKSQLAIELAEKKYYPDLTPGFSYFEDRKGNRIGTVKTRESFATHPEPRPSYWFGENDAYIREARLNYQSFLKKLEDDKKGLHYKVKKFFYELEKTERAARLYEKSLLPLAQKALEVSIAEYQTGKTDFLSLLDAETTLLNLGIDHQRALKNHGQSRARLEKLIGKQLPEHEVKP